MASRGHMPCMSKYVSCVPVPHRAGGITSRTGRRPRPVRPVMIGQLAPSHKSPTPHLHKRVRGHPQVNTLIYKYQNGFGRRQRDIRPWTNDSSAPLSRFSTPKANHGRTRRKGRAERPPLGSILPQVSATCPSRVCAIPATPRLHRAPYAFLRPLPAFLGLDLAGCALPSPSSATARRNTWRSPRTTSAMASLARVSPW